MLLHLDDFRRMDNLDRQTVSLEFGQFRPQQRLWADQHEAHAELTRSVHGAGHIIHGTAVTAHGVNDDFHLRSAGMRHYPAEPASA